MILEKESASKIKPNSEKDHIINTQKWNDLNP